MKYQTLITICSSIAMAISAASCASDKPFGDTFATGAQKPVADATKSIPKDAQYTIYCQVFNSPANMEEAQRAKKLLTESTPLKDWHIMFGNDQSTLYYGYYRTFDSTDKTDPAEAKRALADLNAIREIHDSSGNRIFSASLPVPIDSPDPTANPAWDLSKSPGYWSVEVGAFNAPTRSDPNSDPVDRKTAAVQAVHDARAKGIEAYYYHGPMASSVCIGAWPAEAAIEHTPENLDPNKNLLVTPSKLPDSYTSSLNANVQTTAPEVQIVDPTLTEAINKWAEHDVNGAAIQKVVVDPVTKAEKIEVEKPFLVKIPHPDGISTTVDHAPVVPTDDLLNPTGVPRNTGRLRSLDDK